MFLWPNGVPVPFTVVYNGVTGDVSFTVDGVTVNWTATAFGVTQMFLRARAVDAGNSVLLSDLQVDGDDLCDDAFADGNGSGLDILHLADSSLEDGFTLTGNATLSWTGSPTALRSRLAFQIKLASQAPVPTQETTWGDIKASGWSH